MPVTYSDDPTGAQGPQGHAHDDGWDEDDSANLDRSTKALAGINLILLILTLISAAGLVLGIIGYSKVVDRLDNIEYNTGITASAVTPAPTPTPSPTPSPTGSPEATP